MRSLVVRRGQKMPKTVADRKTSRVLLNPDDWVDAAVRCMLRSSVDGVSIEKLARTLGVTRGSFYWHFRNRAALLDAVLRRWEWYTIRLNEFLNDGRQDPSHRLLRLLRLPERAVGSVPPSDFDLAIRGWARRSAKACAATKRVEALRHAPVFAIFRDFGVNADRAQVLSLLCAGILGSLWRNVGLVPAEREKMIQEAHILLIEAARRDGNNKHPSLAREATHQAASPGVTSA
jgi:AcrR family transcriptional regulator